CAPDGEIAHVQTDVVVTDTMPDGLTPTGASGAGFSCSITGQVVRCISTATMAAGTSAVVDVTAMVARSAAGTSITNTASVASLVTADVVPSNNADSASAIVPLVPDLPVSGANPALLITLAALLAGAGAVLLVVTRRRRKQIVSA
ncbi:MAG TPA: hypothetical protein PLV68_15640, partial [Ilumatobacteraceae bacterium]|nr:hypothetical protein [Ilumatobacteraceae bacterium]